MKKLLTILTLLIVYGTVSAQNYYFGVYNSAAQNCNTCHSTLITGWAETKHANAQADGAASAFYGYSCLGCHNTGFDPNTVNGGADEYVTAGENNTYTISDETNFNRVANVQCEACHGPHGNSTGTGIDFTHITAGMEPSLSADICAQCHTGSHHPTFDNWQESKHSVAKFTSIPGFEFIASNSNCAGCHTAEGFLQFLESSDLEPNVEAPGAEGNDITCSACHDPHSHSNDGQLRLPKNEICQKCHNPEYSPDSPTPDGSELHHTTAHMYDGVGGWHFDGYTYQSSIHTVAIADKCVTCHVFQTEYQGGDPEIPAFTGHSFEPHPESCVQCHADFDPNAGSFDYRGTQTEIADLMAELKAELDAASPEDSTTETFLRAKFNYDFVNADGSMGIHNTKYAKGLLQSAIDNFTPTDVEHIEGIPSNFELGQNYPNPFNPSTTIRFSIPEASQVSIIIYDAIGNEIETLVNSTMSAGKYKVSWDASRFASGIYLYKMTTKSFVQARKMLLVK